MITLLETVAFKNLDDLLSAAYNKNSDVKEAMKKKYEGSQLSFQVSTDHDESQYLLKVYERLEDESLGGD